MFDIIDKIFPRHKKPKIELVHEVFGVMSFMHDGCYWEAAEGEIFYGIPGDERGPNAESIDFVLSKIEAIDNYWELCSEKLLSIAHGWDSIDKSLSSKELFRLSAISVNSDDNSEWEICFETKPKNKWIYIGLHFKGNEIVANDITT